MTAARAVKILSSIRLFHSSRQSLRHRHGLGWPRAPTAACLHGGSGLDIGNIPTREGKAR